MHHASPENTLWMIDVVSQYKSLSLLC